MVGTLQELQGVLHRAQAEHRAVQLELSARKVEEANARRHATELQVRRGQRSGGAKGQEGPKREEEDCAGAGERMRARGRVKWRRLAAHLHITCTRGGGPS